MQKNNKDVIPNVKLETIDPIRILDEVKPTRAIVNTKKTLSKLGLAKSYSSTSYS